MNCKLNYNEIPIVQYKEGVPIKLIIRKCASGVTYLYDEPEIAADSNNKEDAKNPYNKPSAMYGLKIEKRKNK